MNQLKVESDNCVVYANQVPGSRRVLLVWKWNDTGFEDYPVYDKLRSGESLMSYLNATFKGSVGLVTGMPGKR